MKRKEKNIPVAAILLYLAILAVLILLFGVTWGIRHFGNVTIDEIIFHIKMPLKGTSEDLIGNYLKNGLMPALCIWIVFLIWTVYPADRKISLSLSAGKHSLRFGLFPLKLPKLLLLLLVIIGAARVIYIMDRSFALLDYAKSRLQSSPFIENEFVRPEDTEITFPEDKKNLICIFLESMESSAQDKANGGVFDVNYIPELTNLAKENISFSQSDLLEGSSVAPGCSYTIAGMVAQTSGLPSFLPLNYDMRNDYSYFLPGVTSLGELLEAQGYRNYFMAGSDFSFGGRRRYFTSHGNYEIYDYLWAKETGHIPQDYKKSWGFEDAKLYELAKEMITEAAEEEGPFNFSMLTVDTHTPSGYLCDLCEAQYDNKYANVHACAARQLNGFIEWAKTQDWYENTVIYISGDHLSMDPNFYGSYLDVDYNNDTGRKVYNAFINSVTEPVKEKNRRFTTLDMFPSILSAMGVRISGERLGLGTNLFSDRQTLSEEYGYEYFFKELKKRSHFYESTFLYP